jgi:anti-sigma factor RsiW
MNQSHDDLKTLQRFLDGELQAAASAALRTRLAAEPELRRQLAAEQRQRDGFVAARANPAVAPAGFAASVLAAVRQLPGREQIEQQEVAERVVRLCRRVLLAAALVFGIGLAWHSGLLDSHSDKLEAAPDEIESEMKRLDALIPTLDDQAAEGRAIESGRRELPGGERR